MAAIILAELAEGWDALRTFLESGGQVLWLIAGVVFAMWYLGLERWFFYRSDTLRHQLDVEVQRWQLRAEYRSWFAHQHRQMALAELREAIHYRLSMIRTLTALCPLLGLLGTVTGMIEVFHVMAVSGGGNVRAMAGGVSHATIPTMAGMVAALSGVVLLLLLDRMATQRQTQAEAALPLEWRTSEQRSEQRSETVR